MTNEVDDIKEKCDVSHAAHGCFLMLWLIGATCPTSKNRRSANHYGTKLHNFNTLFKVITIVSLNVALGFC